MKRICSVLVLIAILLSTITVAGMMGSADETANEIQFRGFEKQSADYSIHGISVNHWGKNAPYNTPAVGDYYMGGVFNTAADGIHHYVYAYGQGKSNNADGTNADGATKLFISDPTQVYVSLDLYVSDASLVKNTGGDCGIGVDTEEFGEFAKWGSTFYANRQVITPMIRELKDGWNHLLIPLKLKSNSMKNDMANQTVTFTTMRFYVVGLELPAGFVSAVDDVRFMNKQATLTTYVARTAAKTVTDMIRAYPANPTSEDFYQVYLAYNATPDDYKSLIIGWDAFASANSTLKAQAESQMEADKAAVAGAITAIDALNKTITKEDAAAIEAARAAYDALTDHQKVLVVYDSLLINAETELAAIIKSENSIIAKPVVDAIRALPITITLADKKAVEEARAAYDALTEDQKALVPCYEILQNAEKTLADLLANDPAAQVMALIDALPQTITQEDVAQVEAARTAYDALTDDQKAVVTNLETLVAAEEQVKNLGKEDPAPNEFKLGDLDGDGFVNAKDALLILKYAVGKIDHFPIEQ